MIGFAFVGLISVGRDIIFNDYGRILLYQLIIRSFFIIFFSYFALVVFFDEAFHIASLTFIARFHYAERKLYSSNDLAEIELATSCY